MLKSDEHALKVAEFLLEIKAIKINSEHPFTWASGLRSPIYCDNRKTLSYPKIRTYIRQQFAKLIEDKFDTPDVVAGVATGGIAIGALVAEELGLPFIYVRSGAKSHGLNNQVEGVLKSGQKVVVIEDLISTGKSSLDAVKALRDAGAQIVGMTAIFTYGFQIAKENFENAKCDLETLSNYPTMLEKALDKEYINEQQKEILSTWNQDPKAWSNAFQEA